MKKSFWDVVSGVYDFFERVYNRQCYDAIGVRVAEEICSGDNVLECACGTGAISVYVAPKCASLTATDLSVGMLRRAERKCAKFGNVRIKKASITSLKAPDGVFDKVIAGNVIHLLDEPYKAIEELMRVCKPGGKVIIPTYINKSESSNGLITKLLGVLGVEFKREFDLESYGDFFREAGYECVRISVVEGRVPCAVAVIEKK